MSDLYSAAQYLLYVIFITIFVKPLGEYLGGQTYFACDVCMVIIFTKAATIASPSPAMGRLTELSGLRTLEGHGRVS
jgi:hypothetical protein